MQAGIRAYLAAGGMSARYAAGVLPYTRPNVVVKEPTLDRPTMVQMSATERSV